MAHYLALDVIEPGDIVLSAGLTKTSIGIRLATFSRVSHVAVALHPLIWFEARVSDGVVYKVVKPDLVWDGENVRLAMRIPRGEKYIVKRLKAAPYCTDDPVAKHTFARSLLQATSRFAFLNYATPGDFLPMLKFKLGRTRFVRFIVNNMNRSRTKLFPGPFCSWLVTDLYNELGLELLDIDPQTVTPRAIDKSGKLQQVKNTIGAKPLGIAPHFESFERQLRFAVALNTEMLSSLFRGALLAKTVATVNEHIVGLGRLGTLFGVQALEKAADALGEIDERSKMDFEFWQNNTLEALDLAYTNLATSASPANLLTFCQKGCLNERKGGASCAHLSGCHKVIMGTLQSSEDLYRVFKRPRTLSEAD